MSIEKEQLTVSDYLAIMKRRRWNLLWPFLFVFLSSVVVALTLPPIYKSTSTILIEAQEIPADYIMTTVTSYAAQRLQVINQRIMSSTRLLDVIKRFNLYEDLRGSLTTEEIVERMRDDVELDFVNADIVDRRTGRPSSATIAFTLSCQGKGEPHKIQEVANELASLFIEENLRVRKQQVTETSRFFEQEIVKIKQDLEKLNTLLADYKVKHVNELPELLQINMQSLHNVESTVERFDEQLKALRERKEYLQTQLAGLAPNLEDDKQLAVDEKRLDELKVELVRLLARYSEQYPDVGKTRSEIGQLEEQLKIKKAAFVANPEQAQDNPAYVAMASELASTRSEIDSVMKQIKSFSLKVEIYRQRIAKTPEVEREYRTIVGERDATQSKLDDLTRKLLESKVAEGLESDQKGERFTIIDPARLPEKPFKPNRLAIILVGLVLGLGAGIGGATLAEIADRAVHKAEDLALAISFPVLATIPLMVNAGDIAKQRRWHIFWVCLSLLVLVAALLAFHYLVMDLSVLWARIMRRFAV